MSQSYCCLAGIFAFTKKFTRHKTRALSKIGDEDNIELKEIHIVRSELTALSSKLATYVVSGEQTKAEAMLKLNPGLSMQATEVTDYSDRTFTNISAFEYALWALDIHMLRMIISTIPHTNAGAIIAEKLLEKFEMSIQRGVTYTVAGHSPVTEGYFSLEPLKTAYKAYFDAYDAEDVEDSINAAWLNIGKCQRNLPAVVAQYYCDQDVPFATCHDFKSVSFRQRSLKFYNHFTRSNDSWFSGRLGLDFAILSGARRQGACVISVCAGRNGGRNDLETIVALDTARIKEIQIIKENLTQLLHDLRQVPTPHC